MCIHCFKTVHLIICKCPHVWNVIAPPLVFSSLWLPAVGEAAAGKASRSLAQHIPGQAGVEGMKVAASGAVGELARARIALDERGQRLGELEERTALMMSSAENFSKHAHEVHELPSHYYFSNIGSDWGLHCSSADYCNITVLVLFYICSIRANLFSISEAVSSFPCFTFCFKEKLSAVASLSPSQKMVIDAKFKTNLYHTLPRSRFLSSHCDDLVGVQGFLKAKCSHDRRHYSSLCIRLLLFYTLCRCNAKPKQTVETIWKFTNSAH